MFAVRIGTQKRSVIAGIDVSPIKEAKVQVRRAIAQPSAQKTSPRPELNRLAGRAMQAGASTRKGPGPEGSQSILSPAVSVRVQNWLTSLTAAQSDQAACHLSRIRGPSALLRRALYLKAAAARTPPCSKDFRALDEFSHTLANMDTESALQKSTVIDLDSRVSSSNFEPLNLDKKQGRTRALEFNDTRGDNDGFIQSFGGSCGPAVVYALMCEADPILAFKTHQQGLNTLGLRSAAGEFQANALKRCGKFALDRQVAFDVARINNILGRLKRSKKLSIEDVQSLRNAIHSGKPKRLDERTLREVRAVAQGFPTSSQWKAILLDPISGEEGSDIGELNELIDRELHSKTGISYSSPSGEELMPPEWLSSMIPEIIECLELGHPVILGVSMAIHWMFATHVEERRDGRWFLLSDTYSGRSAWVSQKSLVSGRFSADPFELVGPGTKDWVDSLLLPNPPA